MKHAVILLILLLAFSGCSSPEAPQTLPSAAPETTAEAASAPPAATGFPAATGEALYSPAELTEEEQNMLLKLGMAELGETHCKECIALVMRTVLNRVEADGFGSTVHSVIHARDQFTPVSDGTYYRAEPNEHCYEAMEMILGGWDESQGALYYEFCEGESWHSSNLELLFQHCDTRFYK